jgi:membrane protease YdiL (CAAX protease family)
MTDHPLRHRFQIELLLLLVLTPLFLLLMPHKLSVFVPVALLFLIYILIDARFTQPKIWQHRSPEPRALKKALKFTALITLPPFFLMLGLGIYLEHPILGPNLLMGFGLYLLWALVQQTLFQVYLLGRLKVVFPRLNDPWLAIINGSAYALVHLPYWWVVVGTLPLGMLWTLIYIRYRTLWPLALSHALLATAFYSWILNRDLIAELGL